MKNQTAVTYPDSIWQESMRLGISLLDRQRQDIAGLIEEIDRRPEDHITSEYFLGKFSMLQVVISEYFVREEELIRELAMPPRLRTAHEAKHSAILEIFNNVYFDSLNGKPRNAHEIYQVIRLELARHFADDDCELAGYVKT
jgi:hemerythrin